MSRSLKTGLSLFAIFALHRILSDSFLRTTVVTSGFDPVLQRIVGTLSDLWTAALLTVPVFVASVATKRITQLMYFAFLWISVWAALTAGHQVYAEFFKHQIIPFHLSYLLDRSFVEANGSSFFGVRPLIIFLTGVVLAFWSTKGSVGSSKLQRKREIRQFLGFAIFALVSHTTNIRYRVQWFVPETLQTHYLENLYAGFKTKPHLKALTSDDLATLRDASKASEGSSLMAHLSPQFVPTRELLLLRSSIAALKNSGRRPHIITIASESFRPADSGWTRTDSDPPSVTPEFDELAGSGVLFTQAFSTGPVTRGGQEALWCGVPAATDSSLMRSFPHLKLTCLPDASRSHQEISYWIHGGDARFDSQESFWSHHGVDRFILNRDFPTDTPKTGWGVSDLALFAAAGKTFASLSTEAASKVTWSFILSVTNHIPWDLPTDAPAFIKDLPAAHPAERTTAYFDYALGELVRSLKESNLWNDTLLVIASDHGNLETPRNLSYATGLDDKYERLSSHINLVLSGGITETLAAKGDLAHNVDAPVSQAQVASFLSFVGGYDDVSYLDTPLYTKSPWPVASDLNQYLYLPQSHVKIAKEKVLDGNMAKGDAHLASLRLRGYLQMLYESSNP